MNFADAIRKARHESGEAVIPAVVPTPTLEPAEISFEAEQTTKPSAKASTKSEAAPAFTTEPSTMTEDHGSHMPGSVVRLELFLTPEQLSGLFRAVVATQHSVMTLREASNHVRVPAQLLDELARAGEIPAFLVEGKWRFPRNGLDEWLTMQTARREAV